MLRPLGAVLGFLGGRRRRKKEGSEATQTVCRWLTFRGATCGQSKLHVTSGQCSQPSWQDTHMYREPGQKVTQGLGRTGLEPGPQKSPGRDQEGLPARYSPAQAQDWPATAPPLLPTSLFVGDPGTGAGRGGKEGMK